MSGPAEHGILARLGGASREELLAALVAIASEVGVGPVNAALDSTTSGRAASESEKQATPKRRRVGGPEARTCHNCGQEGHLQRECPLLVRGGGNQRSGHGATRNQQPDRRKGQGDLITEANLRLKLPTDLAPYDRQLVVDAAVCLLNDSNKCVFGGEESTALFPALMGRCMHAKCRRRANGHTNMPTNYVFDDSLRMELFRQAGVTNWD